MDLSLKSNFIRRKIIRLAYRHKKAHLSSCLSVVEILTTLYYGILNTAPKNPNKTNRDRLILSKGHAALALYIILADKGFFPKSKLKTMGLDGNIFGTHPTHNLVPGIEVSTGSLGHGLAIGLGVALAAKLDRKSYRTYVVLSDGECDEGSVWETALLAGHLHLGQLIAIIDYNKFQAFGKTNEVLNLEPLVDKWQSFGWKVIEADGHNTAKLLDTFTNIPKKSNQPTVIIVHTIAGRGLSFTENKLEWHYYNLDKKLYQKAMKELKNQKT